MGSAVFHWQDIPVIPTPKGERRDVFNAPTATLDLFHCHITTLRPGEISSLPHRLPQEELVIVKEGTMEVTIDGQVSTAAAGSMFFFASNAPGRDAQCGRRAGHLLCAAVFHRQNAGRRRGLAQLHVPDFGAPRRPGRAGDIEDNHQIAGLGVVVNRIRFVGSGPIAENPSATIRPGRRKDP